MKKDGSVEIRSAAPQYKPMLFTKEEIRKNGIIRKAPTRMYSAIFEVTATSMMKLMFYFFTIGIIGFPILGLIGTIFYAWWCLLVGLVLGILSFKISR